MEHHDVVIVGGGPAGSTCAWQLRRAGRDVLVVDRATFPRDKPCAGWLTPQVIEELELDVREYAARFTFQPFTAFRTGIVGSRAVATRYPRPVSFGVRRCEFDLHLLARAGAPVRSGVAVSDLRREGGAWVVNGEIRARWLVGAGGHFCPVARRLNPGLTREPVVAAQEVEYRLDTDQQQACPTERTAPELYFSRDFKGYGWCVRKGEYLNIGFGRVAPHDLHAHVAAFLAFLAAHHRLPPGVPHSWPGHAYLLYSTATRTVVGDGVLLTGDAAGLAYEQSGEGIRPAIESGLMAAESVLDADRGSARGDLQPYVDRLAARFGSRRGDLPRNPGRARLWIGNRLLRTRWFTRHVLIDRWFLHSTTPALRARTRPGARPSTVQRPA
jgi:flavin-dependent dehydrogenase